MHSPTIAGIRINGGRLCLSFVNTAAYGTDDAVAIEFAEEFADLVTWGLRVGLIARSQAARLRRGARGRPADAASVLTSAKQLRSAIRRLLRPAPAAGHRAADLRLLAGDLSRHGGRLDLTATPSGVRFRASGDDLAGWLVGPVAISAADLLTSPDAGRVRMCPGDGCHWLFLDDSRNGTRRWCSMASCGNRAKTRAHYARLTARTP
jgi:predicted RNA-binding Zn ribbon-like protein